MYRSTSGAALPEGIRPILEVHPNRYQTIQAAVTAAPDGALILIAPGTYNETVTVPFAKSNLELVADGPKFSVKIKPTTAAAKAMVVDGWNIGVEGIDFIGQDTATAAVLVTGEQFHWKNCRFENNNNAGIGLHFKSKGLAAYEAGTAYSASIGESLGGNEYCWTAQGLVFEAYSGLSATQVKVKGDTFRNNSANDIGEAGTGDGGVPVKNVMVDDCIFAGNEDGSAPSDGFIHLDAAGDTGIVSNCTFAYATHEADVIKLAATVLPVCNHTVAGISAAVPS